MMKLSQAQIAEMEAATEEEKKEDPAEEVKKEADAETEEQKEAESIEETRDTIKWKQEELDFGTLHGEQKDLAKEAGIKEEEEAEPDTGDEIRTETAVSEGEIVFQLNGAPLRLPQKEDGSPYYLMDMIQYSGIDLKNPKGRVELTVNGVSGLFQQELKPGDNICIQEE